MTTACRICHQHFTPSESIIPEEQAHRSCWERQVEDLTGQASPIDVQAALRTQPRKAHIRCDNVQDGLMAAVVVICFVVWAYCVLTCDPKKECCDF